MDGRLHTGADEHFGGRLAMRPNSVGAIALFATLALAACGGGTPATTAGSSPQPYTAAINIGFIKSLVFTGIYSIPKATSRSVNLVQFTSGVDETHALDTGDIDFAPISTQQFLIGLSQGESWVAVSGINRGGLEVIARPGIVPANQIDQSTYRYTGSNAASLLKGKKIGIVRGTYPDEATRAWLLANGLTPDKDVKMVTVPSFPDMNTALSRGDIDAAGSLDPYPLIARSQKQAVLLAYPYPQDRVDYLQLGGLLVTKQDFAKQHPDVVQDVVRALVMATNQLNSDPKLWLSRAQEYLAFDPKILALGIDPAGQGVSDVFAYKNNYLDFKMYLQGMKKWGPLLVSFGYLQSDPSSRLASHVDYTFLQKATSQSADALGKNSVI
jgi:NitT/TauT family transport system substrate-binding protein